MLLAIDVGNSNIVLGGYLGGRLCFSARIATQRQMEADEYAVLLRGVFALYNVDEGGINAVVIASVVAGLVPVLQKALAHFTAAVPRLLCIGDAKKCGVVVAIDNPEELGTDILASAIAVRQNMPLPAVIIDMGTATKITALDAKGRLLGVAIMPGLRVSLDALVANASALRSIALLPPKNAIGRNTAESMRSGVLLGNAAMLDGMIDRFAAEMGALASVVATGGVAWQVAPCCQHQVALRETLLLDGLAIAKTLMEDAP